MNPKKFFKNNLFSFVISTAFMAALCAVAFVFSVKAGMFSSVLLVCYLVYVFVYVYFGSGDAKTLMAGKSLASHTYDFISEMNCGAFMRFRRCYIMVHYALGDAVFRFKIKNRRNLAGQSAPGCFLLDIRALKEQAKEKPSNLKHRKKRWGLPR